MRKDEHLRLEPPHERYAVSLGLVFKLLAIGANEGTRLINRVESVGCVHPTLAALVEADKDARIEKIGGVIHAHRIPHFAGKVKHVRG